MALRSVTVTLPADNSLHLASKTLGTPGAPFARMIEAAIRAYRGESREQIQKRVANRGTNLKGGGRKVTQVDAALLEGVDNVSRAARIGLALLMYEDFTPEEAREWEASRQIKRGRPRKNRNEDGAIS